MALATRRTRVSGRTSDPMAAERERRWDALALTLPDGEADEVCGLLAPITQGMEMLPAETGRTRVRIFLRNTGPDEACEFAGRMLAARGLDLAGCAPAVETVHDGRWVERYQEQLVPFPLGNGFTVLPSGSGRPAPGRTPLYLVPGRAFGTGEHPTTQLCAELLERCVRPGQRWLDVGCGTAILSIVARRAGAGRVLAVDVDPEAVEVAREVLESNRVEGVELAVGGCEAAGETTFDGVVVNISAPFFEGHAAELAARLAPGGTLIASGFIDETAGAVVDALSGARLQVAERRERLPWVALVGGPVGAVAR